MLNLVRSSGAADEDRELWAETLKDSDSGFITDPYSVEEFGKIQECSCEQSYSLMLDSVCGKVHEKGLTLWSSKAFLWKQHVAIDPVVLP